MSATTVTGQTDLELKFLVPAAARANLAAEMARGSGTPRRASLAVWALDTEDGRLARAGLCWHLRREGRRWIQTLTADGAPALAQFQHAVLRDDASHDASAHAGTPAGDRLIRLLRRARAEGLEPVVRFKTALQRSTRRVRTRGAVVALVFDEGRLLAGGGSQRIREIGFELCSGSAAAMLGLVERWRKRYGLVCEPRSSAERAHRLADGTPFPPVRKAERPRYSGEATAAAALAAVLDECLAQITYNAIGLIVGDPALRGAHVHQLRVGIRRLRSALRSFQGWVPPPPAGLEADLRSLFATLGLSRDSDVLDSGVAAELARAGAPALVLPAGASGPDVVATVAAPQAQQAFLAWSAWRVALDADGGPGEGVVPGPPAAEQAAPATAAPTAADLRRGAQKRLKKWHARIVADAAVFDALDEEALHALRKRIKRQRYAVEFFAPLLKSRQLDHYLASLAVIQDRMGALNDLFVARARYQALVASDAAAWFALGWLAARIAECRAHARPALQRLAKADPPEAGPARAASARRAARRATG